MVEDNPYQDDDDIYQLNDDEDDEETEVNETATSDSNVDIDETKTNNDDKSAPVSIGDKSIGMAIKFVIYFVILLVILSAGFLFYKNFNKELFEKGKSWVASRIHTKEKPKHVSTGSNVLFQTHKVKNYPIPVSASKLNTIYGNFPHKSVIVKRKQNSRNEISREITTKLHEVTQSTAKHMDVMTNQMVGLQKENQKLIESLRRQQFSGQLHIKALSKQVDSLKGSLSGLKNVVLGLTSQIRRNHELQKMLTNYRVKKKRSLNQIIRSMKRYFVQAVIPGRAWIKASDGSSETVTVGDYVKGYGEVTGINSISGVVSTSSGVNINYGVSTE